MNVATPLVLAMHHAHLSLPGFPPSVLAVHDINFLALRHKVDIFHVSVVGVVKSNVVNRQVAEVSASMAACFTEMNRIFVQRMGMRTRVRFLNQSSKVRTPQ